MHSTSCDWRRRSPWEGIAAASMAAFSLPAESALPTSARSYIKRSWNDEDVQHGGSLRHEDGAEPTWTSGIRALTDVRMAGATLPTGQSYAERDPQGARGDTGRQVQVTPQSTTRSKSWMPPAP